jgi:hypothetical protein
MLTTRQSITQNFFCFVVINGRVRGGVLHNTFTMKWIWWGRVSAMEAAIWIGKMKTSRTTIDGRVAHLHRVVCKHGVHGHIMIICRLLVGCSFHLKVFIVFEILCSCNIKDKRNISRCIGYKFLKYTFFTDRCYLHTCCICVVFLKTLMGGWCLFRKQDL